MRVYEQEYLILLWNQEVQTDKEVMTNRPDLVINNKRKTYMLVDVAIPADRNVTQ
jgi:hypothetical protein